MRFRRVLAVIAFGLGLVMLPSPDVTSAANAALLPSVVTAEKQAQTVAATSENPLVFVLDLSSSMLERDALGVEKLGAAKEAINRVIRSQDPSLAVGLWGYPGSDDDCHSGQFVVPPQLLGDVEKTTVAINALGADGGTPTAQALVDVVSELKSTGYSGATLVLVSDGESNCSSDPCEVARDLVGSGFELTVEAVGFQQSEAGRAELTCIATATGGHYTDVTASDELLRVIDAFSRPKLSITVDAPTIAVAGGSMTIAVEISNQSKVPANNANVHLAFGSADSATLFPAVVPPTYRLGNIPALTTVTRRWTLSLGAEDQVGSAHAVLSAWASTADPVRAEHVFDVVSELPGVAAVGEVLSGVSPERPLVILGDSFSSGTGGGDYEGASLLSREACFRSAHHYAALFSQKDAGTVKNLACHGAQSDDLSHAQHRGDSQGSKSQFAQLEAISAPAAVVMTLGGNDAGFSQIVQACILGNCADREFLDRTLTRLRAIQPRLAAAYVDTWDHANSSSTVKQRGGEHAPVIVLAYPQLTQDPSRGACGKVMATLPGGKRLFGEIDLAETRAAQQIVAVLNSTIRDAVDDARKHGAEVYFVAATQATFLPSRTVCNGSKSVVHAAEAAYPLHETGDVELAEWITNQESFHPKASGYRAMNSALLGWLGTAKRVAPTRSPASGPEKASALTLPSSRVAEVDLDAGTHSSAVERGAVRVQARGFAPHSPVFVTVHSTPTSLGALIADDTGVVNGEVRLPQGVAAGMHTIETYGFSADGQFVSKTMPFTVVAPWPVSVVLIGVLSVALLCGAGVLRWLGRSAPRRG